ncbi:hypothetical protein FCM35_KLT02819 [Carex littledalei]|uniref:Uncharacterized protein n=1 Tax=Carex littledalei TaxID=544730 RepID=A0A833R0U1_9POAL|nr:hypothetical protein FCM35_KLT02819 [Carex littledalei]
MLLSRRSILLCHVSISTSPSSPSPSPSENTSIRTAEAGVLVVSLKSRGIQFPGRDDEASATPLANPTCLRLSASPLASPANCAVPASASPLATPTCLGQSPLRLVPASRSLLKSSPPPRSLQSPLRLPVRSIFEGPRDNHSDHISKELKSKYETASKLKKLIKEIYEKIVYLQNVIALLQKKEVADAVEKADKANAKNVQLQELIAEY